jgi:phosphatidylglycerophosphate synthase
VTALVIDRPISANTVTLTAWGCGVAAAAAFGWGQVTGWLLGAGLLQLWYLLDHVDGQLARYRGTASLDGVQLDYLMHHTVCLLVPIGVGGGLAVYSLEPWWLIAGLAWGLGLMLIGLLHDARYKAFIQRLKRLRGRLHVVGGGGGAPGPQPAIPRHPVALAAWFARKACEVHVLMNVLSLVAVGSWLLGDTRLWAARVYVAAAAPLAVLVFLLVLYRSQSCQSAEQEFTAWFTVPEGSRLEFSDGWWLVTADE